MKKWVCLLLAAAIALSLSSVTYAAKYNPIEAVKLNQPNEQYGYAQGMTVNGQEMYVMDGTIIQKLEGKQFKEYFNLQKMSKQFEKEIAGLGSEEAIHSFRLSQMTFYKNELYVSGLMFINLEDQKLYLEYPKYVNPEDGRIVGKTYTVLFKVKKDKTAELLFIACSKVNTGITPFSVFETQDGRPQDLYAWGDYTLYDYAKYVPYPHFSFYKDEVILLYRLSTKDEAELTPLNLIVQLRTDGVKVQTLYEWRGSLFPENSGYCEASKCGKYQMPVREGNVLTVYDGGTSVHKYNLATEQLKTHPMPEEMSLERPVWGDKGLYFLNNNAVFSLKEKNGLYSFHGAYAKEFKFSGNIAGYAVSNNFIYLMDFDNRVIYKYNNPGS
ncbi:hypothetical protein YSY43_30720 [Paenibacillus sp. YSY-4.3]